MAVARGKGAVSLLSRGGPAVNMSTSVGLPARTAHSFRQHQSVLNAREERTRRFHDFSIPWTRRELVPGEPGNLSVSFPLDFRGVPFLFRSRA
jgi:hypothetical protein